MLAEILVAMFMASLPPFFVWDHPGGDFSGGVSCGMIYAGCKFDSFPPVCIWILLIMVTVDLLVMWLCVSFTVTW